MIAGSALRPLGGYLADRFAGVRMLTGLYLVTGPLKAALTAIVERRIGVALFTAGQQVEHVLQVAADAGIEPDLRAAFAEHVVIGSIGPTTSAVLRAHGLPVDIKPEHPKSGHLVAAVAAAWRIVGKAI